MMSTHCLLFAYNLALNHRSKSCFFVLITQFFRMEKFVKRYCIEQGYVSTSKKLKVDSEDYRSFSFKNFMKLKRKRPKAGLSFEVSNTGLTKI